MKKKIADAEKTKREHLEAGDKAAGIKGKDWSKDWRDAKTSEEQDATLASL